MATAMEDTQFFMGYDTVGDSDDHSFVTSREVLYHRQQDIIKEVGKAIIATPGMFPRGKSANEMLRVTEAPKYNIKIYKQIYEKVEIIRSIIQRDVDLLLSVPIEVRTPNSMIQEGKDESPELIKNMGFCRRWMRYKKFRTKLRDILVCAMWAGNSYSEIVVDKTHKSWKIADLKHIPPDEMRPIRDETGEVLGYVQYPFVGYSTFLTRDSSKIFIANGAILFEPEEILHVKIDPLPGEAYGTSRIEAVKDVLAIIVGMREDIGIVMRNYAAPTILFRVGTDLVPASKPTVIDFATNLTAQMASSSNIVTSTMVQADILDTGKKVGDLDKYFRIMLNLLFGAMGLPEIMLGQGNETTEATAKIQLEAAARRIKTLQQQVKDSIELEIFSYLSMKKHYKDLTPGDLDYIPELWFGPIETEEDKRIRLENGFSGGALAREEYRKGWGYPPSIDGTLHPGSDPDFIMKQAKASKPVASMSSSPTKDGGRKTQKKSDRDTEHGKKDASTTSKKKKE